MNIGVARGIFSDINSDKFNDKEKAMAIYKVMQKDRRIKDVTKKAMCEVIMWLWNRQFRLKKDN